MTRVHGVARDPESGAVLAGRPVSAELWPPGATVVPIVGGSDHTVTDAGGNWTLALPPTGSAAAMKIRVWRNVTLYVTVPAPPPDPNTPVEAIDYLINPDTMNPTAPSPPGFYLARSELGSPLGVASLNAAGKVPSYQLPTLTGGGGDGQVLLTRTAALDLGGHRVVTLADTNTLIYASNDDPAQLEAPLWLTLAAIVSGAGDAVLAYGPALEPTWAWNPGPLYLGTTGLLTQTPPSSPALFSVQVGYATSPTRVFFDRRPSIALS